MDVSDISKYEVIEEGIGDYDTKIYKVKRELSVDDNESVLNKIFKPNKEGKIADYLIIGDKDFRIWHICEKLGYQYKNFELTVTAGEKSRTDRYIVIYLNDMEIVDNLVFMLRIRPVIYIDDKDSYVFLFSPFSVDRWRFFIREKQKTPYEMFNRFVGFLYVDFTGPGEYNFFVREAISDNKFNMIHIL